MRHGIAALTAATAIAFCMSPVAAQDASNYPSRTVTIVNPTLAGSTTDGLARALATGLASRLGQQFVISNNAGGAGAIGTTQVARAEPDGYTLMFGAVYVLSVLPALRPQEVTYKADALTPVCQTVSNAMVLVVRPDSPFKTLGDLVAAARANPGKLNYGHQGPGSIPNLATEEFLQVAQLKINNVPYRGDPAVLTDVLGGNVDVGALVGGTVIGQNLRVLGIFAEERHPALPGAPTVKEQGFNVAPVSFGGLLAPAATPKEILAKLEIACAGAAKDDAYVTAAGRAAQPPNHYASREVFATRLQNDIESKKRLIARMAEQK
jgi:tripartite-type tricarboxylate transporter receptor subunit TctC